MVHAPLFHVRLMSILLLSAYSSKTCKRLLRSETINSIHRLGFTNVLYSPVAPVYVHPKTSIPNQYNDGYKRVTCFSKISHTVNSVSRSVTTNVLYPPGAPAYVRSKTSILNQYIAACNVHSQTPNSDRFSNNQDTTKSNIKASEINNDGIYSAFAECIVTIKDAVKTFLKKLGLISKKPYPDDTADVATFGAKKEDIRHKTFKSSNRLSDDNNMTISKIEAYTILDSRGFPTVAVDLTINNGLVFHAAVPSGASTGKYEALELRDNDQCYFLGKGVNAAINNIENIIAPALIKSGLKVTEQRAIDDLMIKLDGTPNKCKLGANAILGVSIAVANAGAYQEIIPLYKHIANLAGNKQIALPVPAFNVINGGSHAGNKLAMQEFMILPTGANSFSEAMRMGSEVYHNLKNVIKAKYGLDATLVGDEGGFAPNILDSKECLRLIESGIKNAGYMGKVKIGMDVAASEFYIDGKYDLDFKNKSDSKDKSQIISTEALTNFYIEIIKEFPIVSIEDPFDQDHWEAWTNFTASTDIQIVGDDLTVTNPIRITKAISKKACNCLLLKINQIGTVTESIDAHLLAKKNGWSTMVSHRSGETEDTFIADLVVGLGAKEIKAGAPCRSERNAKYNRLVRIERELEEEKKRKDTNDDCS